MFSLLFLHFFLYGCNIFAWRKARINYSFIFELSPTKELKYRDVFLICTTSMTVVVGVMFVHLFLLTKGYSYTQVQAIPGLLLLVISSTSWHDNLKKEDPVFNLLLCADVSTTTCVPLQHHLQIKSLSSSSCDKKYNSVTSVQGTAYLHHPIDILFN